MGIRVIHICRFLNHLPIFPFLHQILIMRISVFRRAHFNAAHRLHVNTWSDEKNKRAFGPCNNPNFHGHNYEIEVKVSGETDPETGILINLDELKQIIKQEVEHRFDHKNLNLDVPVFSDLNPTAENICFVCWKLIREKLPERFDLSVRLFETPRNYVEYPA